MARIAYPKAQTHDMLSAGPSLASFDLLEPLARGGMGEVWSAQHRPSGREVALKVLHAEGARKAIVDAFQLEARAAASLNHDGVVQIYEFGRCGEDSPFVAGSPWLAMELCRGGSLADRRYTSWADFQPLLVRLLRVLAYTHARGVVHRDLKPENVLFASREDHTLGKLSDFGLATALGAANEPADQRVVGTPSYMAPEQYLQRWRSFCPATDLYALACLAWRVVCGAAPFDRQSTDLTSLARAHMRSSPPPLKPMFDVPQAFEDWLLWLLEKDPVLRPACAADAALQLPLAEAEPYHFSEASTDEIEVDTIDLAGLSFTLDEQPDRDLPRLSTRWHETKSIVPTLAAAGVGVFNLRQPPFVGRGQLCGILWKQLGQVIEQGVGAVVHLSGDAGSGKTRVADEICLRAHEEAGIRSLAAHHNAHGGVGEGLHAMLTQYLSATDLTGAALRRHLDERLGRGAQMGRAVMIASWLEPDADAKGRSQKRRFEQLYGILRAEAKPRGLIVRLEDLQWGSEALFFADYFIEQQQHNPANILLITSERRHVGALSEARMRRLVRLRQHDAVLHLEVGPLTRQQMGHLVDGILGLHSDLSDRVVSRCDGYPLFALQLLADWVRRGWLVSSSEGLSLAAGTNPEIPDSLHQLWLSKLLEICEKSSDLDAAVIRCLGLLGRRVDFAEAAAVFAVNHFKNGDLLVELLIDRGLAHREVTGWVWIHGLLQESLHRFVNESDGKETINSRVAEALLSIHGAGGPQALRIARHQMVAGQLEEALSMLLPEIVAGTENGALLYAREALICAYETVRELQLPEHDIRWCELRLADAELSLIENKPRRALELVQATADHTQDDLLRCRAMMIEGPCLELLGDHARASSISDQSIELARRLDLEEILLRALRQRSWTAIRSGDWLKAEQTLKMVGDRLALKPPGRHAIRHLRDSAVLAKHRGLYAQAMHFCLEAETLARQVKSDRLLGAAIETRAEILKLDNRPDQAVELYRRVIRMEETNGWSSPVSRLNLGMALAASGGFEEAQTLLSDLETLFRRNGIAVPALIASLAMGLAQSCDPTQVCDEGDLLSRFEEVEDLGLIDPDFAWLFEQFARTLSGSLRDEAERMAQAMWQGLGLER